MDNKGCIKCGSSEAGQKEIATTGTGLSKLFDVQHNRFLGFTVRTADIQSFIIKSLQLPGIYWIYFLEADPCFRA